MSDNTDIASPGFGNPSTTVGDAEEAGRKLAEQGHTVRLYEKPLNCSSASWETAMQAALRNGARTD